MRKSISIHEPTAQPHVNESQHGQPEAMATSDARLTDRAPPQTADATDSAGRLLAGAKLLIVEDEFLIAQDLAYGSRREGIDVLGPCYSIDSAIDLIRTTDNIGAAILDLNIRGHVAFDLADQLIEKNIPFIFYTGYESVIVPEKFRMVERVNKPAEWPEIRRALFSRNDDRASDRLVKKLSDGARDLASLMPAIRARARQITANAEMSEILLERTLERAIREIGNCPAGVSMEHWLIGLLENTGIGDNKHVN